MREFEQHRATVEGGWVHSTGNKEPEFRIRTFDAASGGMMFEVTLTGAHLVAMLSNRSSRFDRDEVTVEVAPAQFREHWGMYPWREKITVPPDVLPAGYHSAEYYKPFIREWFEDLPISGQVDDYSVRSNLDSHMSRSWVVETLEWLTADEYAARVQAREDSETEDEEEEGDWDDESDDDHEG